MPKLKITDTSFNNSKIGIKLIQVTDIVHILLH